MSRETEERNAHFTTDKPDARLSREAIKALARILIENAEAKQRKERAA